MLYNVLYIFVLWSSAIHPSADVYSEVLRQTSVCTLFNDGLDTNSKRSHYDGNSSGPSLPYLTFGVGRLLHLPSAEAVSVRPNAQPWCNQKVTVIGREAETLAVRPKSAVKPNKSPATWDWWRVVWLFLSGGLCAWLAPLLQIKNRQGHRCINPTTTTRWQT